MDFGQRGSPSRFIVAKAIPSLPLYGSPRPSIQTLIARTIVGWMTLLMYGLISTEVGLNTIKVKVNATMLVYLAHGYLITTFLTFSYIIAHSKPASFIFLISFCSFMPLALSFVQTSGANPSCSRQVSLVCVGLSLAWRMILPIARWKVRLP